MIRAATCDDDVWIAALWSQIIAQPDITFTTTPKTAENIAALRAAFPFIVSAQDGFATYGPFRSGPGYVRSAEISVHLAPSAWGRGLGRALVTALEAEAATRGIDVMIAGISGANTSAQAFHAALGYRRVGQMPGVGQKGGRRYDLVLMQKFLPRHPDFPIAPG